MMGTVFETPAGNFTLGAGDVTTLFNNRMAEPWELSASIAFLLGDESKYVTKAVWAHDGGWLEGSFTDNKIKN